MSSTIPHSYLELLEANFTPEMCHSAVIVGPYCEIFAAIGCAAYGNAVKTHMLSDNDVKKLYAFFKQYKSGVPVARFVLKDEPAGHETKIIAQPENYPSQCIQLSGRWFTVFAGDKDTLCLLHSDSTPSSTRYGITASRAYNEADPINFGCMIYATFDRALGHAPQDVTAKIESCKAAIEAPPVQQ
jgi:hypothetical protein